jgi:hypothetical protein
VDDMRHACERFLDLWTQQPVGVRDDSNSEHCASVPGARRPETSSSRSRLVITTPGVILGWHCCREKAHFGED